MPDTATLGCRLKCYQCGKTIDNAITFQWGALPGNHYKKGDMVQWLRVGDEILPPFKRVSELRQWNCGSPNIEKVLVFGNQWYLVSDAKSLSDCASCDNCSAKICSAIVEIVKNKIVSAFTVSPDEFSKLLCGFQPDEVDVVEVLADGKIRPILEFSGEVPFT